MRQGGTIVDNFLQLELRHTGEILRMRRVRDSEGQTILALDGWLPPRTARLFTYISINAKKAS
jgi:hypothetical protein